MTEELFRQDATLRDCTATITAVEDVAGALGVRLSRTAFYPLGGGQAGDCGELVLADGSALRVSDTRKSKESLDIVHLLEAGQTHGLTAVDWVGKAVTARIDWQRRERHMRLHTTTHLLCALLPLPVDGCSITADYARMDFVTTEPLDKDALESGIARLVAGAHAVSTRWITDAELDANPALVRTMSVQPPRGLGRVRLLEIAGVDLQPCGGTHVSNTAEIGAVRISKMEKKSARTRRIVLELV